MSLDVPPGDAGANSSDNNELMLGNPSSGFGVGSSSSQSYQNFINLNDLVDDFIQEQEGGNMMALRKSKKPCFLYKIIDPHDLKSTIESHLIGSNNMNLSKEIQKQKMFITSKKCLLLAGAYEQQENKHFAVTNYKEALIRNPECFEAF